MLYGGVRACRAVGRIRARRRRLQQLHTADFPVFRAESVYWPVDFGKDEEIGRLSAIEHPR